MFQFILAAAALFGGGYLAKKAIDKKVHPASSDATLSSKPVDEFMELRSDGLYQFNRSTAVSILGWLGSVSLVPVDGEEGLYDLATSADGSPPPAGTGAGKQLVSFAKKGKAVLLSRDVTIVGRPVRRAAVVAPYSDQMKKLSGEGGALAILIVPADEKVDPTLPALEGFEGVKAKGVPGAAPLEGEKTEESDLPNDLRKQIDELLKKTDADEKTLENVEKQLRLGGYEVEADLVAARRGDVRAKAIASSPEKFFVIPEGHPGAIALAKKLVGDGQRFSELLQQNTALSASADGSVVPWTAGQVVRLPPSWVS